MMAKRFELAQHLRVCFPVLPIPPYPTEMGLDPTGREDEYAGFANKQWTEVDPVHYRWNPGYDISPAIGFRCHELPHMWNYYMPGFMSASLTHETEFEIADGFIWTLRELQVPAPRHPNAGPWWGGNVHFEHYSREQMAAVVWYLKFVRQHGVEKPLHYEWERQDDRMLSRWEASLGTI